MNYNVSHLIEQDSIRAQVEISMTAEENVQIAKSFFVAMGRGDRQGLLALCAEDMEWIIPGTDWPLAGVRHGHTGLEDHFRAHAETMETSVLEIEEFITQGDRVLVVGFARGKVKATNKTWEDHWVFAMTIRNGKLTNIREYMDTQALARASAMDGDSRSMTPNEPA